MCLEAARDFATRLRERVKDVKIFGSQARGEARPGSDLDLFVLVSHEDRALRQEISAISDEVMAASNYRIVPSPLVMALLARERRLVRDIEREGIRV